MHIPPSDPYGSPGKLFFEESLFKAPSTSQTAPHKMSFVPFVDRVAVTNVWIAQDLLAEATCTAAYLINSSPSTAIEKNTPMEMWSGHPNYQLAGDREPMIRTKPLRFRDESNMKAYAFVAVEEEDTHEPLTYQEVVACENSSKWKVAMKKRDGLFVKEQDLRISRSSSWVKAVRHTSIRVILALTACKDYELEQLDVKTAFLQGNFKEVIYMRHPLGYEQGNKVTRILNNFRIDNEKTVKMPLGGHFKLSLKDCQVRDCNVEWMSKVPYANVVRSLMYLMVCTRPDIAYGISVFSRYLANPCKNHWEAVKSTTGYAFLVHGCVVSWKATLQYVVAFSTTEAEYMALTEAVKEVIWLRGLLEELGVKLNTVAVNCDNHGTIHLSRNHDFYERTKHINVRYHFIREVLEAKTVKVLNVGTEHNVTDALTKVVHGRKLQHCLELLSVGVS
nr:hypothetical protein [Tanacetum cinerariifolium]